MVVVRGCANASDDMGALHCMSKNPDTYETVSSINNKTSFDINPINKISDIRRKESNESIPIYFFLMPKYNMFYTELKAYSNKSMFFANISCDKMINANFSIKL
jgi:hypothetical protein